MTTDVTPPRSTGIANKAVANSVHAQSFGDVFRAELGLRIANKRNRRAFGAFFLLGLAAGVAGYWMSVKMGPTPGIPYSPIGDAVQMGGYLLTFLLEFFALSSISRELADGTLSLSLRLVPNRKRLFWGRALFWPFVTTILQVLTVLITIPFQIAGGVPVSNLLNQVAYQPVINALFVLLIVFLVHIVRKGPLALLLMIFMVAGLPLSLAAVHLFFVEYTTFFDWLTVLTPMGAQSRIADWNFAATHSGTFIVAWFVYVVWISIFGYFAWKRFKREGAATA